jgi:hypothetical protein
MWQCCQVGAKEACPLVIMALACFLTYGVVETYRYRIIVSDFHRPRSCMVVVSMFEGCCAFSSQGPRVDLMRLPGGDDKSLGCVQLRSSWVCYFGYMCRVQSYISLRALRDILHFEDTTLHSAHNKPNLITAGHLRDTLRLALRDIGRTTF